MDVYTVEQVLIFYRAVLRLQKKEIGELATCIRVANNAKKLGYRKYKKALEAFPKKLDLACGIAERVSIQDLFARVSRLQSRRKGRKRGNDRRTANKPQGRPKERP